MYIYIYTVNVFDKECYYECFTRRHLPTNTATENIFNYGKHLVKAPPGCLYNHDNGLHKHWHFHGDTYMYVGVNIIYAIIFWITCLNPLEHASVHCS